MDKAMKKSISKQVRVQFIIILAAAFIMVLSVFLPYTSATKEHAERVDAVSDYIDDSSDYISSDMYSIIGGNLKNISIFQYTRIYRALCEEIWHDASYGIFYVVLMALIVALPIIAALLALGRKPIGAMIFAAFAFAVFQVQNKDYLMRGVVQNEAYVWGIAYYVFPIAAAVAFAAGIWMLVRKIQLKKQIKSQIVEQA